MRAVTDNSSNLTRARNVLSNRVAEAQEDDDDDAVVVGGWLMVSICSFTKH